MDQLTDITPERHTKGFSYFEKNPTTEQIFKRRKLSEYSSTFSNNNPHQQFNNNSSSLHTSIDEYTYQAQNCGSSRSSSSNNNNNNNNSNTFNNVSFTTPYTDNFYINQQIQFGSNSKNPKEGQHNFTQSFQPTKQQQNGANKGKSSLKDIINQSQQSHSQTSPQKQGEGFMNQYSQREKSQSQSSCIINRNLFDYNNFSFQQLLNQGNPQVNTNSQSENSQTDRKSFDSVLQASFQNLTINESTSLKNQSNNECDFSQKRPSIINIPKAIKSQTPQYFQINSQQSGAVAAGSTTSVQQNQNIITASKINNILLSKKTEKVQFRQDQQTSSKPMFTSSNKQPFNQNRYIDEESHDSYHQNVNSDIEEEDEQFLDQYLKKVEINQTQQKEKEFQQSVTRGRIQLGDKCPLQALKKQFPIIFPVGIPIMNSLSKLLNINELNNNEANNAFSIVTEPVACDSLEQELLMQQEQQNNYSMMMEQQIDPILGNLTRNERREKVEKYLEKKKNRKWKTIRYNIRKNLADQRERVQGRFVKQKNGRFNFDLLDAQYLKQLTMESDKMRLIDMSHNNTDNSFDLQNHSFDI